jgi:threonine 3-dehydrogenase
VKICGRLSSYKKYYFNPSRTEIRDTLQNRAMQKDKILVIGANGQLGSTLTRTLRQNYGHDNVIASDIHLPIDGNSHLPFEILDAADGAKLVYIIERYRITHIYHLAAMLSAKGEINPLATWNVNMDGLFNVLDVARSHKIRKVFFPSSIAVFGANTPRVLTPQDTIRTPETVFGMSKVAGENWCSYYYNRYGIDVRGLRFPGIMSLKAKTGGSTTDFAADILHSAVQNKAHECFLRANTRLPMIFIDDAVRAVVELMEAPAEKISIRSSYNLAGMSFTPSELEAEIKEHLPNVKKMTSKTDYRQKIADSWPESVDDSQARKDWHWLPQYDLPKTVETMIQSLKKLYAPPKEDLRMID